MSTAMATAIGTTRRIGGSTGSGLRLRIDRDDDDGFGLRYGHGLSAVSRRQGAVKTGNADPQRVLPLGSGRKRRRAAGSPCYLSRLAPAQDLLLCAIRCRHERQTTSTCGIISGVFDHWAPRKIHLAKSLRI